MTTPLLKTKLQRTALGDRILRRPHLLQRLDRGLSGTVTLVTAPTGYGKSTIVSSWVEQIVDRSAMEDGVSPHTCWLSLDEADSYLPTFVRYLVASIESAVPYSYQEVSQLVQKHPPPTIETLAAVLVNLLSQEEESLILVLDDLHRVESRAVFAFLARIIDYAPHQVHFVLISRVDPPLPISRWRATGRLHELRLHDLSFTLEEMTKFFSVNLEKPPPASLIESIHRGTEGWIVGSWLALLVLRGQTDYAELTRHFQVYTNRYTADYLVDEVLSQQPPAVQSFLVCTAILNRFCAKLCAAVLEIDVESASAQIEHLVQENLFVIELGAPGTWYRYHHQFQEMLLSRLHMRLDQAIIADLHRRATAWLVHHRYIGEGISHLAAISDYEAIADLVAQQRVHAFNQLHFLDYEVWLNQIPLPLLSQRPDLLVGMAWVKHDHVDTADCLNFLQQATDLLAREPHTLSESDQQKLLAEIDVLRLSIERTEAPDTALARIEQAWAVLREDIERTHCSVGLSLAYSSQELGRLDFAMTIARTTLDAAAEWPLVARCRITHAVGFFHFCRGEIEEAERRFQQNLLVAQQHDLAIISVISHHGLGAVADVRNNIEQAREHHVEVIKHPYVTSGRDAVVDMYGLIGIFARMGEPEKSRWFVDKLAEDGERMAKSYFLEQLAGLEAYVNLTCGDIGAALLWALSTTHVAMKSSSDRIPLIRARILLADGSEACLQLADQILQGLVALYARSLVWHRQVEALILQALVQDKLERPESALALVADAVRIAVPRGGVGLFLGYDRALERMLGRLEREPDLKRFVKLLSGVFTVKDGGETVSSGNTPGLALIEALTERELEVLHLLAIRYTNKEIARHLMVSPNTVRNHTANIYAKLQVTSRRDAVMRAHSIGLLAVSVQGT